MPALAYMSEGYSRLKKNKPALYMAIVVFNDRPLDWNIATVLYYISECLWVEVVCPPLSPHAFIDIGPAFLLLSCHFPPSQCCISRLGPCGKWSSKIWMKFTRCEGSSNIYPYLIFFVPIVLCQITCTSYISRWHRTNFSLFSGFVYHTQIFLETCLCKLSFPPHPTGSIRMIPTAQIAHPISHQHYFLCPQLPPA